MTGRRIGFWLVLTLIAVLLAAGIGARQAWHGLLQANDIQALDWRGLDLSLSSLSVDMFTVRQVRETRKIAAQGRDLRIDWAWNGLTPQVTAVTLQQLQLDVQGQATPETPEEQSVSASTLPQKPPSWLPRQLTVEHFDITLPCANGRCPLQGSLTASRHDELLPARAQLELQRQDHRIQADVTVGGTLNERLTATGSLSIDGQETLSLETDYRPGKGREAVHWNGTVDVPHLPRTDWLLDWFRQWQPLPVDDLPPSPDTGEFSAQWQLQWPAEADFMQEATGSLSSQARLPQPWPLPGVGMLQGQLGVELDVESGQWRAQTAQADIQLSKPAGWVNSLPEPLRPNRIALKIQPAESLPNTDRPLLPMKVTAQIRGDANLDLDSHLAVSTEAPWRAKLGKTKLRANLPRQTLAGWQLEQPSLDLTLTGQADAHGLTLNLSPGSHLNIDKISSTQADSPLSISGLQANFANAPLEVRYELQQPKLETLSLRGPVSLATQRLQHPQLKPQSWSFNGNFAADLKRLALNGRIKGGAGAEAGMSLRYPFGNTLSLEAEARIEGKQAGKAWADTLTAWPATLSVDQGAIEMSTRLELPNDEPLALESTLDADGLAVTYNRMAVTDIDGEVVFDVDKTQLRAHTVDLRLGEVNPGIPIGPINFTGKYEAPLDRFVNGTLTVDVAKAELLGGKVRVAPQRWPLAEAPIRVPLQVSSLQLSRLMELYPAENLSGTGTLNGEIPVWISSDGVHVENGQINAEKPGGRLRLPGERLAGLAQGNAAMQIVVEAMKNFHYSVLDSTIDYAKDGTLNLDLHLEGNNPNVRDGQPVVLNVNLEEDIPALLTSLQLSGRVNDAVTERVKKLIEKQQSGDTPDLEIKSGIE